MYILAILAVLLVVALNAALCGGLGSVVVYFDVISLIMILILIIPVVISAGLIKDFGRAFLFAVGKRQADSLNEINRSIVAVKMMMSASLLGGGFLFLCSVIQILMQIDDLSKLGPNVSIAIITMIYSLVIALLLLPIKAKLEIQKQEYMQRDE